ncbi:MAG: glycine cleavage system aminomethyltransferase GcvT [Planctomycetes bacterium]|nr:glycine cleavage system aminomethyltransferase GcvT [Planctomycetota bacterium]MBU1519042.1 glycine cleavage system aminomethyltransferase GcvT [Planctomycetota bacterium]MBU2457485.1 glycine cleavage system aminomethyltransferase GcvT [Planctomycetota bacterium]
MTEAKKTVLFEKHAALAGKAQIVPFAGWMMPLWYTSIRAEHTAVRKQAGLFDCTHMAVLKIAGKDAMNFLNILTTNDVSMLKPGKARYSYILTPAGDIIDDIIVYCQAGDNFMVVANASNEQKVKDWIKKVRAEAIGIDKNWQFEVADLKDASLPDARVDIALQGPASAQCLKDIFGVEAGGMKSLSFITAKAKNLDVIITSTGYTGAKVSFELFVHPSKAPLLWDTILEKGAELGIVPCGLGSRDSLRIEAGLPLYGHELAGDFNISPFQVGYPWAVKLQKENFIGKEAITKKANFDTEVARLKFDGGKGIRPIRQLDGILNSDGVCIGQVLSCAGVGDKQIALALIKKEFNVAGKPAGVYYLARNQSHIQQGRKEKVTLGAKLTADITGQVVERFEKF